MNLRTQLIVAFLALALVPSAIVSAVSLRQLVEIKELWESAGLEGLLNSSEVVAGRSLERMRYDLRNAAIPLVERWAEDVPNLETNATERLYAQRYLSNVGFDLVLIYERRDDGFVLESGLYPDTTTVDFAVLEQELLDYDPQQGPLESSTGAFALVRDVSPDRRILVGYQLDPRFFLSLAEIRLDTGILGALFLRMRDLQQTSLLLIVVLLITIATLSVGGGWYLSHRLSNPVSHLSRQLEGMPAGPDLGPIQEPPGSSREVKALASAFNALTGRLRATHEDLLRAERAAGSALVARHMAHEIRNPLGTLGLATRGLEKRFGALPEAEREAAHEALEAMREEFALLEDMAQTFSELGRMAEPADRVPFDLNELVRSVYALHTEGPVEFELDLASDLPPVAGDERALRRVLSNLVKNAVEAQPQGGRVRLGTRSLGPLVQLSVEDEGPGMPDDVQRRAFEPGFSTKNRGSGVGLFLARAIVEKHGGRIRIESRPGGGTAMQVELPGGQSAAA